MAAPRRATRPAWALAGAALCWSVAAAAWWAGAVTVCPGGDCRALDFDRQLLTALYAWQRPWLDAFFRAATWLGSILVLLPLSLAVAWRLWRDGRPGSALFLPLATGGAALLAHAGKLLVVRPRPDLYPALIAMPADLSFPIAHAMQATAFALAWVLLPALRPGWATIGAAAVLVAVVAFSRIYLQVHFPSDVLIGLVAGAAWAAGLRFLAMERT